MGRYRIYRKNEGGTVSYLAKPKGGRSKVDESREYFKKFNTEFHEYFKKFNFSENLPNDKLSRQTLI